MSYPITEQLRTYLNAGGAAAMSNVFGNAECFNNQEVTDYLQANIQLFRAVIIGDVTDFSDPTDPHVLFTLDAAPGNEDTEYWALIGTSSTPFEIENWWIGDTINVASSQVLYGGAEITSLFTEDPVFILADGFGVFVLISRTFIPITEAVLLSFEGVDNFALELPTAPATTPLSTPTGLYADNITSDSARVSWSAVENASGYKVEYRKQGDTTWNE